MGTDMACQLYYRSGEEILRGDRVSFHGHHATIEMVAIKPEDPEQEWYVKKYGGGIMILDDEPAVAGRTFIEASQIPDCDDLEFMERA